jgi:hypothetical protein
MEFRVKQRQLVLLHYGYKWIWLTAAGSSGLPRAVFHNSPLLPTAVSHNTCIHSVTILTAANLLETPLFFL